MKKVFSIVLCLIFVVGCYSPKQSSNTKLTEQKLLYYDWLESKECMFESKGKKFDIDKFAVEDINGDGIIDLLIQNNETNIMGVCSISNGKVTELYFSLSGVLSQPSVLQIQQDIIDTEDKIERGDTTISTYKYFKNRGHSYIINNGWLLNISQANDSDMVGYEGIVITFKSENILYRDNFIDFFSKEGIQIEKEYQNKLIDKYGYLTLGGDLCFYENKSNKSCFGYVGISQFLNVDLTENMNGRVITKDKELFANFGVENELAEEIRIDFKTMKTGESIKSIREIEFYNRNQNSLDNLLK